MKSYLNTISILICVLNLVGYILFFNGIDLVPDGVIFSLLTVGSIVGLTLSWMGRKGVMRNIGLFGNAFILLFTVIGPLIVRTFIWNTP